MKLNIAYPRNGTVWWHECNEEHMRRTNLNDYRLGQDVDGEVFDPSFKGYVFRLKGGADKQGFPMVTGVLANARVSLLIKRGAVGFNTFRGRNGERRRKSVRGCIVGSDIAVLNVVIVKVGDEPIEKVTTVSMPRRLGPKRASKIRKLFNLSQDDDVRAYVVRRKVEKAGKKIRFKAPKVQRLITPLVKARRLKKVKAEHAGLRKTAEKRREYLHNLTRERMASRQRKAARVARQHAAKQ